MCIYVALCNKYRVLNTSEKCEYKFFIFIKSRLHKHL